MTIATVTHTYQPRGAAKQLLENRAPEILLSGPAGTGKSRACLEKLHLQALKYPGMRALIVRKTQVSLGSTALVTWREHVAKEALAHGEVRWYGGSQQEAAQYRYRNGSTITVGGMDKATKIMSSEYDVCFVQEAIELIEDDWEAITTRLRNGRLPYQQLMADTNPAQPTHWLKQRCDRGATRFLESRHEDNPIYFTDAGTMTEAGRAYIEGKLDKLTGVRYLRLRKGLWVAAEGLIYEGWDPALHLVDRFPIPDAWPRWWSVDFGYTHPFVLQNWAEDPDGRLFLYREIFHTRRLVEDHAKQILSIVTEPVPGVAQLEDEPLATAIAHGRRRWIEPPPRAVICDHDAEGRATLQKHLGMSTVPANKKVLAGLQAGQSRLKVAGDGRPRLAILRDSVVERDQQLVDDKRPACTAEEIPGYVWAVKPGGQLKEEPVKDQDDGCDALRYVVAHRDLRGRPNIRWM
ncbi:MAG TPA: phage terminase large subunit [Streptosporangiaceae bacterium]|jgi:phage terminase large subunit|nr:phage terminase large subunit [Streptosporangiaceae bacterium]